MNTQKALAIGLTVVVVGGGAILYFVQNGNSVMKSDLASTTILANVTHLGAAADAPTCTLTTDKRLYAPGATMHFTWTSKNATDVTFVHRENVAGTPDTVTMLVHVPDGSGSPNIDSTSNPANGSRSVQASWGSNYEVAILEAHGAEGDGYCTAQYYVGNDDLPSGTTLIPFSTLPVTLTFDLYHTKAISNDGTLSITRETYSFLRDANGTISDGSAVFLIRDGKTVFPAYVSFDTPQRVSLARGDVLLSLSPANGNAVLKVIPQ
jgi:hypothetical protein